MVGLIIVILIIFGVRLFWPESTSEINVVNQNDVVDESSTAQTTDESFTRELELKAPNDEERSRLIRAEYEILEDARKKLKRHIAQLKHDMWGMKFAPDTAKKISTVVLSASKLLKNPHMLGAFSSVEGIKDEIAKVNFAEKSLEEVDKMIQMNIEATKEG